MQIYSSINNNVTDFIFIHFHCSNPLILSAPPSLRENLFRIISRRAAGNAEEERELKLQPSSLYPPRVSAPLRELLPDLFLIHQFQHFFGVTDAEAFEVSGAEVGVVGLALAGSALG